MQNEMYVSIVTRGISDQTIYNTTNTVLCMVQCKHFCMAVLKNLIPGPLNSNRHCSVNNIVHSMKPVLQNSNEPSN